MFNTSDQIRVILVVTFISKATLPLVTTTLKIKAQVDLPCMDTHGTGKSPWAHTHRYAHAYRNKQADRQADGKASTRRQSHTATH